MAPGPGYQPSLPIKIMMSLQNNSRGNSSRRPETASGTSMYSHGKYTH